MARHVLDEDFFPIVGWAGPGYSSISDDLMAGMAEAGFNISLDNWGGHTSSVKEMVKALDMASRNRMKLILPHHAYHVANDYKFTASRKKEIRDLIKGVQDHPGLYGYYLRDELRFEMLPLLCEVHNFMKELDPCHLLYVNHFPAVHNWGAITYERFLKEYVRLAKPAYLSYDHYPITVASGDFLARNADKPYVFPKDKIVVKSDYFYCLDTFRSFSNILDIPFWAFACSVRHGPYPPPTEGHIRFQLFNSLAYGAKGLQYFTYSHDQAMIRQDGSTTPTWEIARKVNAEIHAWAPVLRKLRNIGVFHNGPLWSGMRDLKSCEQHEPGRRSEPMSVAVDGDPVTVGFFLDDQDALYLMIVNVNPCDWARIELAVNTPAHETLYCVDPRHGKVGACSPDLIFAPGEARLIQVGGKGDGPIF